MISVAGYHNAGDGGGGTFVFAQAAPCTGQNGGSRIKDLNHNCFDRINSTYGPKEFGAQGNGTDDDVSPFSHPVRELQSDII